MNLELAPLGGHHGDVDAGEEITCVVHSRKGGSDLRGAYYARELLN